VGDKSDLISSPTANKVIAKNLFLEDLHNIINKRRRPNKK
jgi:hypothetical protein